MNLHQQTSRNMSSSISEMPSADSSSEIPVVTDPRYLEIDRKQQLIADLLEKNQQTALIIQQPWNFQWLTSGGTNQAPDGRLCAALYITKDTRVLLTSNADASWIFDTQIPQLGFYVKERNWTEQPEDLANDLCRGRQVVSDTGVASTKNIDGDLQKLRVRLSSREQSLARTLGQDLTGCVERSALKSQPGQTELEVAGAVTHRLMAAGIEPVGVWVSGDGENERYRESIPRPQPINRFATITATGRRDGICVTVSRIMCFEISEKTVPPAYQAAAISQATGIYWSQPEMMLEKIWERVTRSYEVNDFPDEWRLNEQGGLLAQRPCEHRIVPNSPIRLKPGMLVNWRSQVGPCSLSDTILVTDQGPEWLTKTEQWPLFQVEIKGETLSRPALLKF